MMSNPFNHARHAARFQKHILAAHTQRFQFGGELHIHGTGMDQKAPTPARRSPDEITAVHTRQAHVHNAQIRPIAFQDT
jgi:hypothetical protein